MYVSMLRAINLGPKNKVPMPQLVKLYEAAGCSNVSTYIQSGNVIFDAPSQVAKGLSEVIADKVEETFGFRVPVIQRSHAELVEVAKRCPFQEHVQVMFLDGKPSNVDALDPDRSPGDTFHVVGREIFLCCPNGVAHSKLTNTYFEKKLGVQSTVRNLKTVEKLVELSAARG